MLIILVSNYGIMKITKSLGADMSYSKRRSCTKISCKERNMKKKKKKYIVLDEITEKEIPKVLENKNVKQHEQQVPQTPSIVVRRSTRLSVKNQISL
jgi:ribosome biogenesis GTPase A